MDDYISRQAAINAIEEMQMPIMRSEFPEEQFVFTGMSEALSAIKALPSAQPESQWIPYTDEDIQKIQDMQSAEVAKAFELGREDAKQQWIPVKTRPMTEDEREYWSEHYGYDIEYEYSVMFDCKMPKDKQAIWVQSKCGYVFEDICENDDGMIGLEGNGDWNDIVAWMPKYVPEPWRGEEHSEV